MRLFRVIMPLSYLILTFFLLSYPQGWSDDIWISTDTIRDQDRPDIDVDGQNNVWINWDDANWYDGEVYYSKRDSLGNCLISQTNISNNSTKSWMSRIAVDQSGNAQFIWRDNSPQGFGIWHAKIANNGTTLIPAHLAVSGGGGLMHFHEITLDKNQNINVVWEEYSSSISVLSYSKLDTNGNPIIEKIVISRPGYDAYLAGIGADSSGNLHIGYRLDTVGYTSRFTYTKLDKDGNIIINNRDLGMSGNQPTLIVDHSQNVHVVYGDDLGPGISIKYLKLDSNGNILINPKTLNIYERNTWPHMAMDSLQYLHVVWEYCPPSLDAGIMYAKLDTLGNFIITPTPIIYPPYSAYPTYPRIVVDRSNRLHVTWEEERLNPGNTEDIFYKRGENEIIGIEARAIEILNQNKISVYPNPFYKDLKISYSTLRNNEQINVGIYDISGRKVRGFTPGELSGTIHWDGSDKNGNTLPAGVYFIHFLFPEDEVTKLIIKLK